MSGDGLGVKEEFLLLDRNDSWPAVFQQIRTEAAAQDSSTRDSRRPEFRNRNRYRDVNPYDHSRVRIAGRGIDYINASLVESPLADRSYILTQGPLLETAGHFWLMVWEQDSRAVLMLNKIIEKDQVKCYQYYPVGVEHGGEDEMIFDDVGLKVLFKENKSCSYHYTARAFIIHNNETNEEKEVIQFHYTAWPDFGVPESPAAFLDFLFAVRKSGSLDSTVGPAVIHCSAGIGRSGTFCLVDTCLVLIEQNGSMADVRVRDVLLDMRTYRMGLIQTPDQLRFSYLAIVEGAGIVVPHLKSAPNSSSSLNAQVSAGGVEERAFSNGRSNSTSSSDAQPAIGRDGMKGAGSQGSGGVASSVHPAHQARLRRAIPHACSTEESSQELWSQNNPLQSNNSEEPLVMPGEEQCIATTPRRKQPHELRRRPLDERKKRSIDELTRMRENQDAYGLTQSLSPSRRVKRTQYQTIGALVAIIGAYLIYRLCGG